LPVKGLPVKRHQIIREVKGGSDGPRERERERERGTSERGSGKFSPSCLNMVRYCSPLPRHLLDNTKNKYKMKGSKNEERAGDGIFGRKTIFHPARDAIGRIGTETLIR
jgi:hypothetical protein